jgi:short-subunit dehydrogenase
VAVAPAYNASKAYQINYLSGLRKKMEKLQLPIYITDIKPGFVDTDMAKGEGKFWVAPVNKAASQIITAIKAKRKIVYITKRWRLIGFVFHLIS